MRTPSRDLPHPAASHTPLRSELQPTLAGRRPDEHGSSASLRLQTLAALSGSLTDALAPEHAAALVEQRALSAIGATSAVIMTRGQFPPAARPRSDEPAVATETRLHVVHSVGLPAAARAALDELPLDAAVPLAEVARIGDPLFLASEEDMRRYPDWWDTVVAGRRTGRRDCSGVGKWRAARRPWAHVARSALLR